jgi:hypothetical protein
MRQKGAVTFVDCRTNAARHKRAAKRHHPAPDTPICRTDSLRRENAAAAAAPRAGPRP